MVCTTKYEFQYFASLINIITEKNKIPNCENFVIQRNQEIFKKPQVVQQSDMLSVLLISLVTIP